MTFRLTYLHLTLAHSKGQSQGHAHLDGEYLANDARLDEDCNFEHLGMQHVDFRLVYLHFILVHSKWYCQGHAHFDGKYLANGTVRVMHISTVNTSQMVLSGSCTF